MSTNRWIYKEDVVYIYNEISLCHKQESSNAIWNNINGPRDYHAKSNREKNISLHVESKKMLQMNLFIKEKHIHRHRKKTFGYQRGKIAMNR